MLVYSNRPITEFRASLLARPPAERAAAAVTLLDTIVVAGHTGPVVAHRIEGVMVVAVGTQNVFVLLPADVDELAGETLEQKTAVAVSRLQTAIDEQVELRMPRRLALSAAQSLLVTMVLMALLWTIRRGHRALATWLPEGAERRLQRLSVGDLQLVRATRASDFLRRLVTMAVVLFGLALVYSWLTFVLTRFPYTRPWGESLKGLLIAELAAIGLAIVRSVPDLFTVAVIFVIIRFVIQFARRLFDAAAQERVKLPGVHPETAQPTRRLVSALLWLFALALSYPYLPGSDSDAFKGMSVFLGLLISLGSSGIVNQAMSGLTITYSRAVRIGDYVKIGNVEGTVTHLGSLSTKIETDQYEDVTIPNAVVVSNLITNYSRIAHGEGVLVPVSVTIGYDVPWRQVHAMLLRAAERTKGVQGNPAPVLRQTDLRDFYVEYTLLVCLEQPSLRATTLGALRANIQDVFNEFGVQIMSPNYLADPHTPKLVPREKWYAAPASPPHATEIR